MNINTFEKLQLNEVKELIKNYCVSSLGKDLIDKLNPSDNFNIVKRRLSENKEARKIINHILELLRTNDNSSETHINEIINELKVILEKYIKQYPDKTNILDLFNNLFNNKNGKKMTV